jgi:ribokinase
VTESSRGTVAVLGYASIDSTTSIAEFHGIDATSILTTPMVSATPGMGGIAHLSSAVTSVGCPAAAVSWVGPDQWGTMWTDAVASAGAATSGIAASGTRSPSATLIEVGTGGTICLFDPGDCHVPTLTTEQVEILTSSDWVLLTVAPGSITSQVLDVIPAETRLVWAVKHDDAAYTPALIRRMLERANVVSFSRGERPYVTIDGVAPESFMREGALVIETRGADGVTWAFASAEGPRRRGRIAVEKLTVDDTTGAGDTFIGSLVGRFAQLTGFDALTDDALAEFVSLSALASGDLLRARTNSGRTAGAPHKENH